VHACRSITRFGFPTASHYNYKIDVHTRNLPDMQRLSTCAMSSNYSTRSVPSMPGTTTVGYSCAAPRVHFPQSGSANPRSLNRDRNEPAHASISSTGYSTTNRPDRTMDNHQRLQRVMHHVRAAVATPPSSNVATPIQQHGSSRQHFCGWMSDRWHADPLGPPTSAFGESTDVHTTARACATSNTAQPAIPIITTDCVLFQLGYFLKTGRLTISYGIMYFKTRQMAKPLSQPSASNCQHQFPCYAT
jgi:hypothetical protein